MKRPPRLARTRPCAGPRAGDHAHPDAPVRLEVAPRPLQRRRASTAVATRRMIMQASAVAGHEYPGPLDFKSDLSGRLCPMSPVIDSCPLEELPPGEHVLVEWEDLELGVVNCNGELLASEDRCSHDDGDLLDGDIDCDAGTVECSRHGSVRLSAAASERSVTTSCCRRFAPRS